MKKAFIFLISGEAPDLGSFSKGEVREFEPREVATHAGRKTMMAVDDLSKDVLIYWLVGRGIDPPDKANKTELRKLLIYGPTHKDVDPEEKETMEEVRDDG